MGLVLNQFFSEEGNKLCFLLQILLRAAPWDHPCMALQVVHTRLEGLCCHNSTRAIWSRDWQWGRKGRGAATDDISNLDSVKHSLLLIPGEKTNKQMWFSEAKRYRKKNLWKSKFEKSVETPLKRYSEKHNCPKHSCLQEIYSIKYQNYHFLTWKTWTSTDNCFSLFKTIHFI